MEREIDYICHACQLPVYKVPRGYFSAGHRCQTREEFEEDERRRREYEMSNIKIVRRYLPMPIKKLTE